MATATNSSSDTCCICTDKFKKPKLLPCFHTFCLDCLQQFVSSSSKDGRFPCPMCRYQVTLPEGGVAGFQTNFYIEARVEKQIHGGGECCGMCEQRASHTCRECEILLCDACTKYHNTLPATKCHMLINLGESDSGKPVLSIQRFCDKHVEEKLRFYCIFCSKVICRDCKLTDHDGHKTKDICDVAKEARTTLLKTKVELEKCKTDIDDKLENINRNNTSISETADKSKTQIHKVADSVGESINNARRHLISRLTDIEEKQKKIFFHEQETLSQRKCFIQSQIDHTDAMLREGVDCDVISTDGEMKQRLTEIQKEQSIGSDYDSQPAFILSNLAADLDQLEVLDHAIKDITNDFTASKKNASVNVIKTIKYYYSWAHSITFTNSQKVFIVQYSILDGFFHLCLYEKSSSEPMWNFKVQMNELRVNGIHGVVANYNKANPHNTIPADDYTNLKKPFPMSDTNDDGDKCRVVDEYNIVVIKPYNGVVRMLTVNPFDKTGQQFEPIDVCWGNNQEVYIVDGGAKQIVVYSLQKGFQKSLKIHNKYSITAIAMDREGNLWVSEFIGKMYICDVV